MNIHDLDKLDSNIVYGIVNEKLRLECDNIDDVIHEFDLDKTQFEQKLDEAGYIYDPSVNQLRIK